MFELKCCSPLFPTLPQDSPAVPGVFLHTCRDICWFVHWKKPSGAAGCGRASLTLQLLAPALKGPCGRSITNLMLIWVKIAAFPALWWKPKPPEQGVCAKLSCLCRAGAWCPSSVGWPFPLLPPRLTSSTWIFVCLSSETGEGEPWCRENANEQEMNLKELGLDLPPKLFDHKLSSLSPAAFLGKGCPEVNND